MKAKVYKKVTNITSQQLKKMKEQCLLQLVQYIQYLNLKYPHSLTQDYRQKSASEGSFAILNDEDGRSIIDLRPIPH